MIIKEALVNYTSPWAEKHLKTIEQPYSKTKYKNEVLHFMRDLLEQKSTHLVDITVNFVKEIARKIGMETQFFVIQYRWCNWDQR